MNAKYYPIIKLCRQAALLKRRLTLPVKLFTSGFVNSESYYPEMPQKSKFRIAMDLLGHIMKYGSLERYYFSYGLDIKGFRDKDDYLDDNWFLWKCAMLNTVLPDHDYTCILRDKDLFATLLTEWGFNTPHTIACVKSKDDAENVAKRLLSQPGSYFCKPLDGQCGGGIFSLLVNDCNSGGGYLIDNQSFIDLFEPNGIIDRLSKQQYLIQNLVVQHPEISRIYDKSINTIRLVTLYDKKQDEIVPLSAVLRIGAHGNVVDNWAKGGLAVGIDMKNGMLKKHAFYKQGCGTKTLAHPGSKVAFDGFVLPFFEEAVQQAKDLHHKLRPLAVIGWDIAITPNGPLFIEGNDNMEISINQETNGGLKKEFDKIFG